MLDAITDNNYYCERCGAGHEWALMTSTPEGNLFCPSCWKKFTDDPKRKCPVDQTEMNKRLVAGVMMLDQCPECEGTWFDKNELKLLLKNTEDKGWETGFIVGAIIG